MPNWRNRIKIKYLFGNNRSDKKVLEICDTIIPQLELVLKREICTVSPKILDDLEQINNEFKWIKQCIEKKKKSSEFGFDNWHEAFNRNLAWLYDIGDIVVKQKGFTDSEKFLWVE